MKMKPKSCGCCMCRAVKSSEGPTHKTRKLEERAFRRRMKVALLLGSEMIEVAPHGSYIA